MVWRKQMLALLSMTAAATSVYAQQCPQQQCFSDSISTFYSIRSQSFNGARRLSGEIEYMLPSDDCSCHGFFSAAVEYLQSFRADKITHSLFGTSSCPTITISGSGVANRNANSDWLADYFYLPPDYQSTLSFKPRIDSLLVDFNFYAEFNEWCPGLYIFIEAPLQHTRWKLRMNEVILSQGIDGYAAGIFTPQSITRAQLLNSFTEFAQGLAPEPVTQAVNNAAIVTPFTTPVPQITVNFEPLTRAKISPTKQVKTRFADIRGDIGYIFALDDCYYAGLYVQAAAPAGNRPKGKYLFEPMVGNNHHAELGVGIQGRYEFWCCDDTSVSFYGDAVVTHLFGTRERRTFDLCGKRFSRYMLAEKLQATTIALSNHPSIERTPLRAPLIPGPTSISLAFGNAFTPVANLSTVNVHVQATAQCEITAMLNVAQCDWNLDVGYNFWVRSCDKVKLQTGDTPLNGRIQWALKGNAQVFGFAAATDPSTPSAFNQFDAIPLSATESCATISQGTQPTCGIVSNLTTPPTIIPMPCTNVGVDNSDFAFAGATNIPLLNIQTLTGATQIQTSVPPVLLSINDLDLNSSNTRGMSSTLFANLSYQWSCVECQPFFGVGGQVEIGHGGSGRHCTATSLSQWGVWLKAGVTFE